MTISIDKNDLLRMSDGSRWKMIGKLSFVGPYTSGGEILRPIFFGLSRLDIFSVDGQEQGYSFEYDYVNQKLKVFSGSGSGATSSVTAGTPTGTVDTPIFTGDPIPDHLHATLPVLKEDVPPLVNRNRIYFDESTLVGAFVGGETITGGTSGDTAIIGAIVSGVPIAGIGYFIVSGASGNFTYPSETLTGSTSGATVDTVTDLYDVFDISSPFVPPASIVTGVTENTAGNPLVQAYFASTLPPGFFYRFNPNQSVLEARAANGFTTISAMGLGSGTDLASIATPSGTNSALTFTGDALPTHFHVVSGSSGEVLNGTDLSFLTNIEFDAIGL